VAGLAGSGGAACVPSIDSWEACGGTEIDRCGPVPDGCTDDGIDCGGCAPNKICSSEGVCEPLYPCDCTDRECGRLTTCDDEARSLCGPDAGECGTGELCFEIGIPGKLDLGTTCRVPTFQTCFAPQETCCDTKPTECSVGYSNCVNFYAVSLATGEPCGSCMTGGIEHKCGPGY